MSVGVGDSVGVVEANLDHWNYDYTWDQIGNGDRRTLALQAHFDIPLDSVDWTLMTPVQACADNLAKHVDAGWTKQEVLAQNWNVSTDATFSGEIAVARGGNVKPAKQTNLGQLDLQSDQFDYHVFVRCLAAPNLENTLAPPTGTAMPFQPGQIQVSDRPARQEIRPARQSDRPARQETRPARQSDRPERQSDRPERQDTRPPRQQD
ncbi:hypothetical protein QTO30_10800 [Yoonia sp. GPGPB17]|uniref:hypothetical protein n=1 Tax=Yoonia sp. GPGPB17 TaxID=3026147 RepID=UPI0030C49D12